MRRVIKVDRGYLVIGGRLYSETNCDCGRKGRMQAAAIALTQAGIPAAIRRIELLEQQHKDLI